MQAINFLIDSHLKLKISFAKYLPYFLFFVSVSLIDIATDFFIPLQMESLKFGMGLAIFFLTVLASIVFIRFEKRDSVAGDFWYLFIPFLLYSIYYSIIAIITMPLLFIPGVLFFYVPLVATFSDKESPFKFSYKIARKYLLLTCILAFGSLILEIIPTLIHLIPNKILAITFSGLFSFIDAYLFMVLTISAVRIYYLEVEVIA